MTEPDIVSSVGRLLIVYSELWPGYFLCIVSVPVSEIFVQMFVSQIRPLSLLIALLLVLIVDGKEGERDATEINDQLKLLTFNATDEVEVEYKTFYAKHSPRQRLCALDRELTIVNLLFRQTVFILITVY